MRASLMIHKCDIQRETTTRGDDGGPVTSLATRKSNMPCRAVPLKPEQTAELAQESILANYKFYFVEDPDIDKRDYIRYVDPEGNTLTLEVTEWYNPHDMNKFWKVYAQTIKSE